MEYTDLYRFCPHCKADLIAKTEWLMCCTQCEYYLYVNPAPCNAIILENKKGEILLVKRKYDPKKGYWDIPGGFVNTNETLEDSMKREVKEELGIEISDFKYFASFADRYLYRITNYYTLGFVFIGKIDDIELTPKDDVEEIKFFKKNEIPFEKVAFSSVKEGLKQYLNSA